MSHFGERSAHSRIDAVPTAHSEEVDQYFSTVWFVGHVSDTEVLGAYWTLLTFTCREILWIVSAAHTQIEFYLTSSVIVAA